MSCILHSSPHGVLFDPYKATDGTEKMMRLSSESLALASRRETERMGFCDLGEFMRV